MISLIDRYLLQEVFKALFAILLILLLVLVSHSFIVFLQQVAVGEVSADVVFQLLGLQVFRYLARLIPPAFFFAVLYAVGRMYRDSEMIALESCGVGGLRIFRSILLAGLPVSLLVAWLSMGVQPWSSQLIARIISGQTGQSVELAGVSPGRFNEYSKGDLVFYVESISESDHRMHNIFVQTRQGDDLGLVTAVTGFQRVDPETGDRFLVLEDGFRYKGQPGRADYVVSEFGAYALRIGEVVPTVGNRPRNSLPTHVLLASPDIYDRSEFQYRLSPALGVLAFALLSLPLSRSLPRQGPFGRLALAFLIYTIYLSLQGVSENWMKDQVTPAWLGMWWVHLSMGILALVMLLPDHVWYRRWRRRLKWGDRT